MKPIRVCCTEEMSYSPWGFFKAIFADYFQLPLLNDVKIVSKFDEQILKFHKPLFDLYFNNPVKAMSPEDARFTYMEAWSKFLKILTKTVIIVEGFENIDDTSLQTLELYFDKFTNVKTNFVFITNENLTPEQQAESLKTDNRYGKCVWDFERDGNVDHQAVMFNFKNGATATHNMIGGTARSTRTIHVVGTKGEMYGDFEGGSLHLQLIQTDSPTGYHFEDVEIATFSEDTHGGGDIGLIRDFVDYIRDGKVSVECTAIENSVAGHLAVFLADKSAAENGMPQIFDFSQF